MVTLIEILRGIAPGKRGKTKKLLEEAYEVVGLHNGVVLQYCALYDKLKAAGETLPDAGLLIAATALAEVEPLKTNDRDFERLKPLGLRLNPPE
ncbi:MAG: hypothetical protein WHS82_02520 [Candidatus Methanosuratincola sp.]